MIVPVSVFVCLHQIGLFSFFHVTFIVLYCSLSCLLKMFNNNHAAFWSSSLSTEENLNSLKPEVGLRGEGMWLNQSSQGQSV